jgi:hypothetical protein
MKEEIVQKSVSMSISKLHSLFIIKLLLSPYDMAQIKTN